MAKAPKFPLEVFDIPQVKRLTAVQYGLFARLAFSFWETGIPLPENPYAIARLANSDLGTIARHRDIVLECIRLVMPDLQIRYNEHIERIKKQREKTTLMNMLNKAKLADLRRKDNPTFSDIKVAGAPVLPVKISGPEIMYSRGKYDEQARKAALEAPKSPEKMLSDD